MRMKKDIRSKALAEIKKVAQTKPGNWVEKREIGCERRQTE